MNMKYLMNRNLKNKNKINRTLIDKMINLNIKMNKKIKNRLQNNKTIMMINLKNYLNNLNSIILFIKICKTKLIFLLIN